MTGALPLRAETETAGDSETRVVSVGDDGATSVFAALSAATAQSMLAELYREPSTPAALAEHVDTSVQNVHYHLSRMEEAGLVEVVGVEFSRRGVEMDVYAPDGPLVVTFGDPQRDSETSPGEPGAAAGVGPVGTSGD